jgi:SAM-dependent methyltransferase
MMLDLRDRQADKDIGFLRTWRALYDAPYRDAHTLPPGPILVVGAGTGNDVSAALRRTDRRVVAVEIDREIVDLGRRLHTERPYHNPRVRLVIDDARSFFSRTRERFALVVFGFLDSHTLLSGFSSLRLDNFVYTKESLQQVERLLVPGGKVALTFASTHRWIHERFLHLLNTTFRRPTTGARVKGTNGVLYENFRLAPGKRGALPPPADHAAGPPLPEDDWPFLYLRTQTVPEQYLGFLATIIVLGFLPLLTLPRGQRRVRLPYFFLGAAFFLIETSNVVSLSLLHGSTWTVNLLVFTGILVLVLLGNLTTALLKRPPLVLWFGLLVASVAVAALTPTNTLLAMESSALRAVVSVVVFLGPVYFASIIFATLIREEENLYQAYGSNVLGAVVGGACEYMSMLFGFKFLLGLTLLFYLGAYVLLPKELRNVRRG